MPTDAAQRLLNGETVRKSLETKKQKHDYDYEVFKKMLDLTDNEIQKASRAIVRLKTTPND